MAQDRDQHDNGGEIDLAAEEAQRWWRLTRPATIDGTAEAETLIVLQPHTAGPAARLAQIAGRMQHTAAQLAVPGPAGIGDVLVTGEQEIMESGIGQQG